jgi:hypothetical protein
MVVVVVVVALIITNSSGPEQWMNRRTLERDHTRRSVACEISR